MPIATAKTSAAKVSSTVPGNWSSSTWVTGRPSVMESPKSNRITRVRYRQYCTQIGWSSPYARLIAATRSGVERSPRRAVAGPPGRRRNHANSRIDRPNRIGMSCSSRLTTKRSIPWLTALGVHELELLVRDWAGDEVPHVGLQADRRRRVGDRQRRQELDDLPVDPLVQLLALGRVRSRVGLRDRVEQGLVGEPELR